MSSRALFALGFLGFLLIGGLQAVYGPAFVPLQERFGVGRETVGLIASAHFLGSMLGILAAGALLLPLGLRRLLTLGAVLLVLGLAVVSFTSSWPLALAGALLGGYGFGHVSVTFNVGGARLGPQAPGVLNLLNACFGLGSVLAPLLVAGLGGSVLPFVILGVFAVALLLLSGRMPQLPETAVAAPSGTPVVPLALFGAYFVLYVGVEAGVGAWMTTHLLDRGVTLAAAWTSAFWLTVTVGRVLSAPVAMRVPLPTLLTVSSLVATVGLLLTATSIAPLAYLLVGLAIAPLFATGLSWFGQVLPTRLAPLVLACGGLGGTIFPALLGMVASSIGTDALPYAFALTSASVVVMSLILRSVLGRSVPATA